ncbi:MAG: hypothetical protein Kow00107_10780 [Planctomycetota bacterium]
MLRKFSLDENVWATTLSFGPLKGSTVRESGESYSVIRPPEQAPDEPEEVEIGFERGWPVEVDGQRLEPLELVEELNLLAAEHGVGRVDLVSDGLMAVKHREVCDYPGAKLLFIAHRALELIVMPQKVLQHQEMIGIRYGELVVQGDWFTTLRRAFDGYLDVTQEVVTGKVRLKLYKGNVSVLERSSPNTLSIAEGRDFPEEMEPGDLKGYNRVVTLQNRIEAIRENRIAGSSPGKESNPPAR